MTPLPTHYTPATPLASPMGASPGARRAGAYISDGLDVDGPWHVHEMHQLLYAFEGTVEVEGEHARFLVPCQLAAWIPAGVVHRTHIHRVRSGSIFFQPEMIGGAGSRVRVVLVPALMREMIMGAMRWPITQPEEPVGRKYFEALAMLCAEWLEAETRLTLPTSADARIRRVMDYTREHLATVDLSSVCRVAGLSERSLRRHFRAATGTTWEEYRRRSRLARAIVLLGDATLTIGTIAGRVGFESQGAFTRALQACIGERPSDYRKRIQSVSG
jgi:AraC-like DNA-binding protein